MSGLSCEHSNSSDLQIPGPNQSVYREDCTQCFDSIDDPAGLNVCLYCFNGGCAGDRNHAILHYEASGHPLVLNIKRKRKTVTRDEPPQKISKLSIAAETEQDRYDVTTQVQCYDCSIDDVDKSSGKLARVVDGVMKANTFARQEEVKAWEQEMIPCEHTLCLEQEEAKAIQSQELGHCASCDLKENLWLCLTCGNLGCGRAQYGGVGGNSHALAHTTEANHPVAVKLGSLTADGSADIYCYACNEERVDPELATHLAHWGINIADRQKTEKSLTELQIEQNLRWEFSMTTEDGKEMKPLFGPALTGLKNLGNSCYLNSILQCLFSFPEFAERYFLPDDTPPASQKPAEDVETQLRKLADGLLSGRYSKPDSEVVASEDSAEVPHQKGLAPAMLKHLIGRGHAEFSTMRQQDAFELLLHILQLITRSTHPPSLQNPVDAFKFILEQRLQCLNCRKVRYRTDEMENISIPVPIRRKHQDAVMTEPGTEGTEKPKDEFEPVTFKECLDIFTASEMVELTCPSCGSKDGFSKRSLFKTFPAILTINLRRFEIVNWLPTKQDVPVIVSDGDIPFSAYKSRGLQDHEELLPEDENPSATSGFAPNEAILGMLQEMGFPRIRCEKALRATGNGDVEAASNWLFEHMEDPDIDEPMAAEPQASTSGAAVTVDPAQIEDLGNMGFSAPQARQALKETGGNMERAVDWLFSHPDAMGDFGDDDMPAPHETANTTTPAPGQKMHGSDATDAKYRLQSIVCHKGSSIHAGHYVAFIRKPIPATASVASVASSASLASSGSIDDKNPETSWILFNDEKVAKAAGNVDEMKKFAYVYFFRRT